MCFLVTFCTTQKVTTRSPLQGAPRFRKPLACFLVLFARRKKNVKTSPLQGDSRFRKPQSRAPQPQLRTATIKTFPGSSEVLQTSEQCTKNTFSHNPIKSFRRRRRHFVLLFVKHKKEDKKRFRPTAALRRGQAHASPAPLRGAFPAGKLGSDRGK